MHLRVTITDKRVPCIEQLKKKSALALQVASLENLYKTVYRPKQQQSESNR